MRYSFPGLLLVCFFGLAVALLPACGQVTSPADDGGNGNDADLTCKAPLSQCGAECVDTSSNLSHCGGCNQPCNTECVDSQCKVPVATKTIFVTSTLHTGNLGGIAGADAICQARAGAAGLGGTFLAWLSETQTFPAIRMQQSADPYVRTDGVQIAASWAALTSGAIEVVIDRDEAGKQVQPNGLCQGGLVWSNTSSKGERSFGPDCGDWASADPTENTGTGSIRFMDVRWSGTGCLTPCDTPLAFYCVEQ